MFGNRKRKLQDEDESLVPHGLVWHATVEPTPEDVAKSEETLGYTVNYAQEIERVRREQSAQPIEQAPDIASQASPAKPVVIPWWRMEQPDAPVERPISKLAPMPLSAYVPTPIEPAAEPPRPSRIQPMQIRPTPVQPIDVQCVVAPAAAVQPIQTISTVVPEPPVQIFQASAPQVEGSLATSVLVEASPISEPVLCNPPAKPQVEERLVPKSSEITEALALALSQLGSAGKTAWLSWAFISSKALERGRQTVRSLELSEGLARAVKHSRNLIQRGVVRTSRYARTTGSTLGAFSRAGVSRLQRMSATARTTSSSTTRDVIRTVDARPATPSRIRLLLATSASRAKIITAQQWSAWRLRWERVAIDSHFWASMSMSAIAAVIALVIVSVVPHYAARSLPSRILNTNPSVNANVVTPASVAPVPVQKTVAPVRKSTTAASTQTTAAKTASVNGDSAKPATNPKPKHVMQDDYVAPNTYKYYGTGSKASR